MDIKDYIKEIDDEILGEKEALISRAIEAQLKKFKFTSENLSPQLIALLMAKADVKIPVPDKKTLPDVSNKAQNIAFLMTPENASIYSDLLVGNNVYLYGKAGTGKTYLAKSIARELYQRPIYLINCNQFTSPIEIRGGQTIEGYKQGVLVEAWKNGGVLILDELPKLDPNTAGILNEALAQAAEDERIETLTKEEYEKEEEKLKEIPLMRRDYSIEKDLVTDTGAFYEYAKVIHNSITDGKGDKIRKNKYFAVIATGNTNLKELSANFSGNNRQDYSLVDRFAGSFYKIEYPKTEESLIYKIVFQVSTLIRQVLDADSSSVESVSLRTMLNFNRTFENEQLNRINSKYAYSGLTIKDPVTGVTTNIVKTFAESVDSFVKTLPEAKQTAVLQTDAMSLAGNASDMDTEEFVEEFKRIHGIDPEVNSR